MAGSRSSSSLRRVSSTPEIDTGTTADDAAFWTTSFAEWLPGPGDSLLRAYSDAVNKRLLDRWLPERCGQVLKTDLFDEVAGDGLVRFLLGRADRVIGIDIAESVVGVASARNPRLEATRADVRSLPFADATFDVVVSTSTLDHFETERDLGQALSELHRVLRPGGSLIVTLDNASNPLVALRNVLPYSLLHRIKLVPYPTGVTTGLAGLQGLVEAVGFEVSDVDAIMHVPRIAVRSAGTVAVGDPARVDRLLAALLRVEPPRSLPFHRRSGQFVAVRAIRRPSESAARKDRPQTISAPSRLSGGPRAIAMRVLGRTIYRRLIWMELDLDQRPAGLDPSVPLEFSFLGVADLDEIAAFRPGLSRASAEERLHQGHRCFGARHDGRLASTRWIATGWAPMEYLGVAQKVPSGTSFLYDLYTDPAVRGLRIAPATASALCRVLEEEGVRTVTAAVHPDNAPALAHGKRYGLKPVGKVGLIRIMGVRRWFRRSC